MRRLRPEVGRDQRFLDVVERRCVESGAAGEAGQIVRDPLGGLAEPAAQAIEPAHAQTAISCLPSLPVMRTLPASPRFALAIATGAKLSVWPLPLFSISTGCVVPARPSSQACLRTAAPERSRAARALINSRGNCGMRA